MVFQEDFEQYYQSQFGERWFSLKEALLAPERQVRRNNTLLSSPPPPSDPLIEPMRWAPHCQWHDSSAGPIDRDDEGLLKYYILDPASVLAAENLKVKAGEKVLDLCAAPGGKSLILAQNLFREASSASLLILNELSASRRERLTKVIQQYVPRHIREQIWVKGKDGVRFGLDMKEQFDAILLDAPCSGERHLLKNAKELDGWSAKRTKMLAQKQYALLASAWLALKKGGRIIYSTCALSHLENDGVIERLLKKGKGAVVGDLEFWGPDSEKTQYGMISMPDRCGFGPMYTSLVIKPHH